MNCNIKALDDVIREIVFNDDVSQLLSTPNAAHSYDGVVQFQVDECEDNGTSIAKEGFQIGEPFDGDIENAPILFLSSNPAFNFDEVSPRYFPDSTESTPYFRRILFVCCNKRRVYCGSKRNVI